MIAITRKLFAICNQCEKPIYKGDRAWFKGREHYCNAKCLIASFNAPKVTKKDFDKARVEAKRVQTMREIYERRKRNATTR